MSGNDLHKIAENDKLEEAIAVLREAHRASCANAVNGCVRLELSYAHGILRTARLAEEKYIAANC